MNRLGAFFWHTLLLFSAPEHRVLGNRILHLTTCVWRKGGSEGGVSLNGAD